MQQVIVRYKVKPDRVAENEQLVRAVYAELHDSRPAGLRYATFKLEDGVSFVHVAAHSENAPNALSGLPAFRRFQEKIEDRCEEPPVLSMLTEIGSYRFLGYPGDE
jgi:quinol monooxygenase YgiN